MGTASPEEEIKTIPAGSAQQIEDHDGNLHYDNAEVEPELHIRTYIAFGSICVASFMWVLHLFMASHH